MRMATNRYVSLSLLFAISVAFSPGCDGGSPTAPKRQKAPTTHASCLDRATFGPPAASPYCLPYAVGTAYQVSQSYCSGQGRSHHLRFAYDFVMPMGTEILAARAGEVVELREHFSDSDTMGGHENVVILKHSDDTLGLYIHMRQNGILPEVGDFIPKGGLLGWVGSSGTGFSHLHFQICLRPGRCSSGVDEVTLPVNFSNAAGEHDGRGGLREGETYLAKACI